MNENNEHQLYNNDKNNEHEVKIHIETPYKKSNTPISRHKRQEYVQEEEEPMLTSRYMPVPLGMNNEQPMNDQYALRNEINPYTYKPHIHVNIETDKRNYIPSVVNNKTKRQLFELMPFVSTGKFLKQNTMGIKRNEQSKLKEGSIQKRDQLQQFQGVRVPFFAESNFGIVHNRHKEESFESFEKKDVILKIKKRAASEWGEYNHVVRDTVHGKIAEKNPILQLLRSAAGKKSQKILGLNSKSFDIFPGPLPEENGALSNLAKASTEAPLAYPPASENDHLFTRQKRPRQPLVQRIRQKPMIFHDQGRNQMYDDYQVPVMPAIRTKIRPKAIVINPSVRPENYPFGAEQIPRRSNRYEQSQQYPDQEYIPRGNLQNDRASMFPKLSMQQPPMFSDLQEPNNIKREEYAMPNENPMQSPTFDRYSFSTQPPEEGRIQNQMNNARYIKNEQYMDEPQMNEASQVRHVQEEEEAEKQQMFSDEMNREGEAQGQPDNYDSREELPSIPYLSNNLLRFPKPSERRTAQFAPAVPDVEYSKQYEPRYIINRPLLTRRTFEDAERPFRRRLVSHIPTPTDNPRTNAIRQFIQGQQPKSTENEEGNDYIQHQPRALIKQQSPEVVKQQPPEESDEDDEKPEVHVHISTEKSHISRPTPEQRSKL